MARAQLASVTFLIGAAVGAAAMLLVPSPREAGLEDRISDLDSDLTDARREAGDWERVALAERERKEAAEEEVDRLRQALATAPAPVPVEDDGMGMGGHRVGADAGLAPKDWDFPRLRREIEILSGAGRRMSSSPRLDACVEAAKVHGDASLALLIDVMRAQGMPANIRRAATLILEKLGDQRAVPTLLTAWDECEDPAEQRLLLRALSNLPGSEQLPIFVDVWGDPGRDARLKMISMHALSTRGHPTALRVIRGDTDGVSPAVRARAIESLHSLVRGGDYEDASFIPVFGKALVTADGEGQQRLTLLALEGYWRTECVTPLREFAANEEVPRELRDRATRWANMIEDGQPRPERAGLPKAQTVDPDEANANPRATVPDESEGGGDE
jgi:uncharacterized protein (UPF0147 family)